MGENIPFGSAMELENGKVRWNLESDLKLLGLLKNTSEEFVNKIKTNLTSFNELEKKSNICSNQVNNLITKVLILTNGRFIENRVYEEDIKEITTTAISSGLKHQRTTEEQQEKIIVDKLKTSIDVGVGHLRSKFPSLLQQPTELVAEGEGNNTFDRENILASIYLTSNNFASHSLPYLLGSDEYFKDTFVGLKKEEDTEQPIIVLNDNQTRPKQQYVLASNNDLDSASIDSLFDENEFLPKPPPPQQPKQPTTPKRLNLVEDESDEDIFETSSKPSTRPPTTTAAQQQSKTLSKLFDDDDDQEGEIDDLFATNVIVNRDLKRQEQSSLTTQVPNQQQQPLAPGASTSQQQQQQVPPQPIAPAAAIANEIMDRFANKKSTASSRLFDESDDDQDDIFSTPSAITTTKPKSIVPTIQPATSTPKKPTVVPPQPPPVIPSTTTTVPKTKPLHSIFDSDSDDETIDVFKYKLPNNQNKPTVTKPAPPTTTQSSSVFSSSSSEEDLFATKKAAPSKKSNPTLPISSVSSALPTTPAVPVVAEVVSPQVKPPTMPAEEIEKEKTPPPKMLSARKVPPVGFAGMSNVISELNSKLGFKKAPSSSSSDESDSENSQVVVPPPKVDQAKVLESVEKTENHQDGVKDPLGDTSPVVIADRSFNDMLRHKASLNVSRRRKTPSRYSLGNRISLPPTTTEEDNRIVEDPKTDVEDTKDIDIVDVKKTNDGIVGEPEVSLPSTPTIPIVADKVLPTQTTTTKISTPLMNNVKANTLFAESDDDEDLFESTLVRASNVNDIDKTKPMNQPVTALGTSATTAASSTTLAKKETLPTTTKKVTSLFSSDDSDEDFFASTLSKTKKQISTAPPPISVAVTSNVSSTVTTTTTKTTTTKPTPSTLNKKKSLFDSDSDDEGLFG